MNVSIFRTGENNPRPTKAVIDRMMLRIGLKSTVDRDDLVAFMTPKGKSKSAFYSLPIVPQQVIDNPAARVLSGPKHPNEDAPAGQAWIDQGWVIPVSNLGRKFVKDANAEPDSSTVESVRLWIKQHLSDVVDSADVAILLTD